MASSPRPIKTILPIVLMSLCGLAVGWSPNGSFVDTVAAYGLMIAFSFAMIWVGVLMGSMLSSPEAVQGFAFTVLFPFTFISSCFVPTSTLPDVLRTIAEWNPTALWTVAIVAVFVPLSVSRYKRSIAD